VTIRASEVAAGDHVRVLPGELVPVDGVLLGSAALMEESSFRGEFFPVSRDAGERVRAGTSPLDAQIELEAQPRTQGSSLDEVLHATQQSLLAGSDSQRILDQLTRWFLPTVAFAALATFLGWSAVGPASQALFYSMAVLLVACPCALGFGTPLALHTAI
jgi:P-type Cu+ transporter